MKYVKTLGLAVLAVTALMIVTSSASATIVTSPTGTVYTGTITMEAHTTIEIHGSFVTVKCGDAHLEFTVEEHGHAKTVKGKAATHTIGECNYPVTISNPGYIEIHAVSCAGVKCTGTLTSTGTEMSISTSIGTCVFTTNNTHIGTLTPTNDTGGHATVDTLSAKIPRTGGNFLCGSSGTMTGAHTVTQPSTLWVNP